MLSPNYHRSGFRIFKSEEHASRTRAAGSSGFGTAVLSTARVAASREPRISSHISRANRPRHTATPACPHDREGFYPGEGF
jgi:hypothetical protein